MFPDDVPPVAVRAQEFLAGVRYPAAKDELLDQVRRRKADEEVMVALYGLRERSYESAIDVTAEIARHLRRFAPKGKSQGAI